MNPTNHITQATKIGAGIIGKTVLYLALGILINWIFALVLLFNSETIGALLPILLLLFIVVLPVAYYWFARRNAIREGIQRVYRSSRGTIDSTVERIVGTVVNRSEQLGKETGVGSILSDMNGIVAQSTQGLPRPVQRLLTFFLEKMPFRESLEKINATVAFTNGNKNIIKNKMLYKVDGFMDRGIMQVHRRWFIKLLGANIAAIIISCFLM